ASRPATGAVHFLAIREWAASQCRPTASDGHAHHARTGLGGGQCEAGDRDPGYRYDGAHPVWPTDGWAQRVQPEEQGQEELSTWIRRESAFSGLKRLQPGGSGEDG